MSEPPDISRRTFVLGTTATVALFCSVLFRKTSTSMMTSYLIIGALFCLPLALRFFARVYFPQSPATTWIAPPVLVRGLPGRERVNKDGASNPDRGICRRNNAGRTVHVSQLMADDLGLAPPKPV